MGPFQSARDVDVQLSLRKPGKREQKQSAPCKSVSAVGELLIDGLQLVDREGPRAGPEDAGERDDADGGSMFMRTSTSDNGALPSTVSRNCHVVLVQ